MREPSVNLENGDSGDQGDCLPCRLSASTRRATIAAELSLEVCASNRTARLEFVVSRRFSGRHRKCGRVNRATKIAIVAASCFLIRRTSKVCRWRQQTSKIRLDDDQATRGCRVPLFECPHARRDCGRWPSCRRDVRATWSPRAESRNEVEVATRVASVGSCKSRDQSRYAKCRFETPTVRSRLSS